MDHGIIRVKRGVWHDADEGDCPRPDVTAVVHCHCLDVIPFAAANVPLRPMYHMGYFIGEGVPVFDIRAAAGITIHLGENQPGDGELFVKGLGDAQGAPTDTAAGVEYERRDGVPGGVGGHGLCEGVAPDGEGPAGFDPMAAHCVPCMELLKCRGTEWHCEQSW